MNSGSYGDWFVEWASVWVGGVLADAEEKIRGSNHFGSEENHLLRKTSGSGMIQTEYLPLREGGGEERTNERRRLLEGAKYPEI